MMDDSASHLTSTSKSRIPPTLTNSRFYQKLERKYPAALNKDHKSTVYVQGDAGRAKVTGESERSFQSYSTTSQYSQILNLELIKSLYEKYPHAFKQSRHSHGATQKSVYSRRIFDSGLRVHQQGDTSFSGNKNICSEMPPSSWDREVGDVMRNSSHHMTTERECMTSPTPSSCSNYSTLSIKERLKLNSQTLNELLSKKFPLRKLKHEGDGLLSGGQSISYTNSRCSSCDSEEDFDKFREYADHEINCLQRKIMSQQKEISSFRKILGIPDSEKTSNSQNISRHVNLQCLYPESLPDSAIDTESGSVHSVSTDMVGASESDGGDSSQRSEWMNGHEDPRHVEVDCKTYSSPFHHFDSLTKHKSIYKKKLKSYQNKVASLNESANQKNVDGRPYPSRIDNVEKMTKSVKQRNMVPTPTVHPTDYQLQIVESVPVVNIKPPSVFTAQKSNGGHLVEAGVQSDKIGQQTPYFLLGRTIPSGEVEDVKPNAIVVRDHAESSNKVADVCKPNNNHNILRLDLEPVTDIPKKKHITFEDEKDDTDPRLGIVNFKNIEERHFVRSGNNKRSPSPYVIIKTVISPRFSVSDSGNAFHGIKGEKSVCSLVETKNAVSPESRPRERKYTLHTVHENIPDELELEDNSNSSHKAKHLPLIEARFNTNSSFGKADTLPRANKKSNFLNAQENHNYAPSQDLLTSHQLVSLSNEVSIKSEFQFTTLPTSTSDTKGLDCSSSLLENPKPSIESENISSAQPDVVFQHARNGSLGDSASPNTPVASETSECGQARIISQNRIITCMASNQRPNGCFPANQRTEDESVSQLEMIGYQENSKILPTDNVLSVHKSLSPSPKSSESSTSGHEKREQFKRCHFPDHLNKSPSLSTRSSDSSTLSVISTSTDTSHSSPPKKFQETSPPLPASRYAGKPGSSDRKFKIKRFFKRKKGSYSPATKSENFQIEHETIQRHASLPNLATTHSDGTNTTGDCPLVFMHDSENASLRREKSFEVLSVKDSDWNSGNGKNKDSLRRLFRKRKQKLRLQKSLDDLSQTDSLSNTDIHDRKMNRNLHADGQNIVSDTDKTFRSLNNIDGKGGLKEITPPKISDNLDANSKEDCVENLVTSETNEVPFNIGTKSLSQTESVITDIVLSGKQPASMEEKCRKVIAPDYERIVDYQVHLSVEENLETWSPSCVFLNKADDVKQTNIQNNTDSTHPYAGLEGSHTETTTAANLYESFGLSNNQESHQNNNSGYESINIPPSKDCQKSSSKQITPIGCFQNLSKQMSPEYASINDVVQEHDRCQTEDDEQDISELYAEVDFTKLKSRTNPKGKPLAASTSDLLDIDMSDDEGPPLPVRYYKSTTNLEKSRELSASKASLLEKMGTIKHSAKKKIKSLRRTVSLDKGVNKVGRKDDDSDGTSQKSKKTLLFKSLKSLFGKKSKSQNNGDNVPERETDTGFEEDEADIQDDVFEDCPVSQTTAKLLMVNRDGTQVIRIVKPKEHSLGVYIGQGKSEYQNGIFVNRFCDGYPDKAIKGLLAIGDEILEINDQEVQGMLLDQVYHLMAKKDVIVMKILPMLARNDI